MTKLAVVLWLITCSLIGATIAFMILDRSDDASLSTAFAFWCGAFAYENSKE